ncbi:hypothetical protein D9613_005329 [Agrocybe pediades]|uniref:Uncharacterized protein n=1 Tax=Agrocybe pediades TaxID=84607 RepID=A0A8H4QYN0_9AGAR|nr:hypothetical protein D9613_005329 [Agrocybe pediades]
MSSSSKSASLAARLVENNNPSRSRRDPDDDDDDEALFAELEEEIENDSNSAIRETGLQVLKAEMERMKHMRENRYGYYVEVKEEKEVVRRFGHRHEPRCVAHFFHPNFKRCEIMDKHLEKLAPKYPTTRFIRVHVENIPWLVEKLFIKVLPCVICFVDGIAKDRLVGFEELGNEDNFNTAILELRLSQSGKFSPFLLQTLNVNRTAGVIKKGNGNTLQPLFKVSSSKQSQRDDDVFDLDD